MTDKEVSKGPVDRRNVIKGGAAAASGAHSFVHAVSDAPTSREGE